MNRKYRFSVLLILLCVVSICLTGVIKTQCLIRTVAGFQVQSDVFRSMQMSDHTLAKMEYLCDNTFFTRGQILAMFFPETKGDLSVLPDKISEKQLIRRRETMLSTVKDSYEYLEAAYEAVWNDLHFFPVSGTTVSYENSWMFERNYGGKRGHEGTDLMPPENLTGYYPVVSITDGTVEKMGWLEQGGYRVGIRSPSGGYFYYAHLDSFSDDVRIEKKIQAGQILGWMGDTGYGPEGTQGKFPVHLHLGIYIGAEEISINPYWILRWLETKQKEGDIICQNASLHLQG